MTAQTKISRLGAIVIPALISVSLICVSALGDSIREPGSPPQNIQPAPYPAFSLTTSRTDNVNGQERLLSIQQRSQRSDGAYKLVQTFYAPDGAVTRVQTYFGFIDLGVFRLDEARQLLVFTGPQIDDRPADIDKFLRAHPLFAREESVAGVSAVVWRQAERGREEMIEEYRAPSLGGLLVKSLKVSARGRETVEPKVIAMGEPAAGLFNELFVYRVDYSSYERQVQETEKGNLAETASLMRQLLERMRQVRP